MATREIVNISAEIISQIASELYDQPIMSNLARPPYVERMVARVLGCDWQHVGSGWNGWDVEHKPSGARLEVKQSARRQSWTESGKFKANDAPRFDIRHRSGQYAADGKTWIEGDVRPADIYVFAWHSRFDPIESVDHRIPEQWQFFVLAEQKLPKIKSIGLGSLNHLGCNPILHDQLSSAVASELSNLEYLKVNSAFSNPVAGRSV